MPWQCRKETPFQELLPRTDYQSAIHVRKRKHSVPVLSQSQNSIIVGSSPEWKVWPFTSSFFFFFLWLPSWWWMWQKYTAVTVHDSTPLRKILVGMPFKVKLELHLECTPGHRALTRVLSDDVMLSKPPCRRQDGKQELQTEKCEKTEIGGDGWDVSGCAAWKHVVLLADFLVFFEINNLLKHDRTVCLLYWHNCLGLSVQLLQGGEENRIQVY